MEISKCFLHMRGGLVGRAYEEATPDSLLHTCVEGWSTTDSRAVPLKSSPQVRGGLYGPELVSIGMGNLRCVSRLGTNGLTRFSTTN